MMEQKHGMVLFRSLAAAFKSAIDKHDVQELERLGLAFIAEVDFKTKRFAQCGTGTSEKKKAAAISNGNRGGRPKKAK